MCDIIFLHIKFFDEYDDIKTCIINVKILKNSWSKCVAAVDEILRICRIWHKIKSNSGWS